jgi:hypothetical protein
VWQGGERGDEGLKGGNRELRMKRLSYILILTLESDPRTA